VNVLILNPASRLRKNVVRDVLYGCWCSGKRIGGGTVPPFSLLLVATILNRDGNDVVFKDLQAEQGSIESITDLISKADVVITSTSTMTFEEDTETLRIIKKWNPAIKTIVFGSHPTFLPHSTLVKHSVDIAIQHEPEHILIDLMRALHNNGDWRKIRGIGFRKNGRPVINPKYPFIKQLDSLPFPDVSFLPKGIDYFNPIVKRPPYIATATSRGCPGKCTFCTAPRFDGNILRFQSASYVLEELDYFLHNGYREVYFRDDTFFVNKKRDREIFQGIKDNGFDVSWIGNARIGMIDRNTMELAKAAGCHTIKFGLESGDQEILDRSNKGYKIEQAYDTFKWARELDISTHAHCMLGMPGDSEESIKKTISFVHDLDSTTATFGICTPYPGTPLFDEILKLYPGIGDGTASNLDKLHVNGLYNEMYTDIKKEKLEYYIRKAYRSFYLRPKKFSDFIRQMRTMDDLKRISLAGTNVIDYALFGE